MNIVDLEALRSARVERDPFDHFVAPCFVPPERLDDILRDYPQIDSPRNYLLEELDVSGSFAALIEDLQSHEFAAIVGEKFGIDLDRKPRAITVRRLCESSDGNIHTDSKTKLVTVLIYFNRSWPHEGGRLRLCRSLDSIEDYATEVAPERGTLLGFKRSSKSFHGHKPFAGERLALQLSWVEPKRLVNYSLKRDSLVWKVKRAIGLSSGGRFRKN